MKIYSPAVRKLAAEAASRACAAVAAERARAEQFSAASPIERVGLLLGGYGGAEQFSAAPGQRSLFDEEDHPRADDGKFATKSGGGGKSVKPDLKSSESRGKVSSDDTRKPSGETAVKPIKLTEDDGYFRSDAKGREVIQWRESHQFPVKVGDVVELDGRTVTVEAIGDVFTPRGGKGKHRYLYLAAPVKSDRQGVGGEFTGDESLDAFEAERDRDASRVGEK